jgi:Protein of unknown function (DUF4089)
VTQDPDFDPDSVIDATAPLLGLTIADEYRAGIATNLVITARLAALLSAFPLGDEEEPAPVFTP